MIRIALRGALASAAIAAALVTITACGGQTAPAAPAPASAPMSTAPMSTAPAGEHVDADVTFVEGMIPHHSQAVDMAKLAAANTTNPEVLDLAARIEKAQAPEIRTMQGFLTAWGMPADTSDGMGGMHHGGSTGGMMSDTQMQRLGQVRGAEFDRMFLTMMIEHHTGAVQMAETELASGRSAEAKKLAQAIIDAQRAEISEMNTLVTSG
jgi:uncharacterized protein (DUF305 family)